MAAVGLGAKNSEEAELMACRRSLEFAVDARFSRLIIEGDNANVIQAISSSVPNNSVLGCVVLKRWSYSGCRRGLFGTSVTVLCMEVN